MFNKIKQWLNNYKETVRKVNYSEGFQYAMNCYFIDGDEIEWIEAYRDCGVQLDGNHPFDRGITDAIEFIKSENLTKEKFDSVAKK